MRLGHDKRRALRLSAIAFGAQAFLRFLTFPMSIGIAYVLGPTLLGMLKTIDLVKKYVGYNHLGLIQVLSRQIPIAEGIGDLKESRVIQDVVFSSNVLISALTLAALAFCFALGCDLGGALNGFRAAVLAATLILDRVDGYLNCYMKGVGRFELITRVDIIQSALSPLLMLTMALLWKLDGVLLAGLLAHLVNVGIYCFSGHTRTPRWSLQPAKLARLFRLGAQIFFVKVADGLFWLVDTTIIAALLPAGDVGRYALALGVVKATLMVTSVFQTMAYRHMLSIREQARKEMGWSYLSRYLDNVSAGLILTTTLFLAALFFVFTLIADLFLSAYNGSAECLFILAIGQVFYIAAQMPSLCLNAMDQLMRRLVVVLSCLGLNAVLDFVAVKAGYGISGAAWASSASFLVYAVVMTALVRRQVYERLGEPLVFLLKVAALTIGAFGLVYILNNRELIGYSAAANVWIKSALGLCDVAIKTVLVSLALLAGYFIAFRRYGLAAECRTAVSYLIGELQSGISVKARET